MEMGTKNIEDRITKYDFMSMVKDILEETDNSLLIKRGEELKSTIDKLIKMEIIYVEKGLR